VSSLPIVGQPRQRSAALLDHLARRMRLRAELVLGPLDLRPRHLVALTLLRDHGEVTQQGLAELLQLDSTNVVGVLNELEERGLILRRRVPTDRRRHVVELTDAGRERLAAVEVELAAAEDEVLSALSLAQRGQLAELLRLATESFGGDCEVAGEPCEASGSEGLSE
jgi:DNA-binding MarR family transcriptional regulator